MNVITTAEQNFLRSRKYKQERIDIGRMNDNEKASYFKKKYDKKRIKANMKKHVK